MGKALPYAVREKIIARCQKGQSYLEIATDLSCSESGVKKIWYAFKKHGASALETKYSNCGGHSIYGSEIRSAVTKIRDNGQGSYYVYSKLAEKYPEKKLPCARTLNRWWELEGSNRKAGRPRASEKKSGQPKAMKLGK